MIVYNKSSLNGKRANHIVYGTSSYSIVPQITTFTSESIVSSGILQPFELTPFELTPFELTPFTLILSGSDVSTVGGFSIGFDGGFN